MHEGKNDWIRYAEVSKYDEERDPRVMILGGHNFDIDSAALLPVGKYLTSDLRFRFYVDMFNHNSSPLSIVVPAKLSAALYVQENFEGTPTIINGPAKVLFHTEGYRHLIH